MSMNLYVRIGVYVELPNVPQLVQKNNHICSNNKCENHKGMLTQYSFCPICGQKSELKVTSLTVNETVDWYSFIEKNDLPEDDLIWIHDAKVVISNQVDKSQTISKYDLRKNIAIDDEFIVESKKEFLDLYSDILDKFEDVYNIKLELKFGVISYYN